MRLTRTHNNRPRRHRAQDTQARGLTLTTKPLWLRAAFRKQAAGETAPWMMSSRCSCAMPKLASLALLSRDTRLALPSVSCSHPLFMACCMSQGQLNSLSLTFLGVPPEHIRLYILNLHTDMLQKDVPVHVYSACSREIRQLVCSAMPCTDMWLHTCCMHAEIYGLITCRKCHGM